MIDIYSNKEFVTAQELHGASNWNRLKQNKTSDKLQKLFKTVDTGGIASSEEAFKKKEGFSEDIRLEQDDTMVGAMNGFDLLMVQRNKKRRKSLYRFKEKMIRREELRRMTEIDEIDLVLTKLSDEIVIINGDDKRYGEIKVNENRLKELGIRENIIKKICDSVQKSQSRIFKFFEMMGHDAWKKFYRFAAEGALAWEIIFDDINNPTDIVGAWPLDAYALRETYNQGVRRWAYREKDPRSGQERERIYFDHQIIKIDWCDVFPNGRLSYLDQILKAYNMLRIITEAKIIYAVTNVTFRSLITIPAKGESRKRAESNLSKEMMKYKDDIYFDFENGELQYNGQPNIPFTKEIFQSDGDNGQPQYDSVPNNGLDMMRLEEDEFFTKRFYASTRIPRSRFDEELREVWNMDATTTYRIEINFESFKNRIKNIFGVPIERTVKQQLVLDVPEVRDDDEIMDCIYTDWNTNSVFYEMMENALEEQRLNHIQTIQTAITIQGENGEEVPYIPRDYLLMEKLNYSTEKIKEIRTAREEQVIRDLEERKRIKEFKDKHGLNDEPEY